MMTNARICECLATTAFLPPSNQAVGAIQTTGHVLDRFRKRLYTLTTGAVAAGSTVTLKVQASADNGTTWSDIPNSASTITTGTGGIARVEIQADKVAALNLGSLTRGVVTVAGAATLTSLLVQAGDARYMPASDYDLAGINPPVYV